MFFGKDPDTSDWTHDEKLEWEKERIRGRIALWSVLIYLSIGALLMIASLLGLADVEDSVKVLQAWGSFASLVVGASIGFYFGTKK